MQIAIIGVGAVGSNLGKAFARVGHEIIFGVREPQAEKVQALLAEIGGAARAETVEAAATGVEIVVMAAPASAMPDVAATVGDWRNKIVIDATNRFRNIPQDTLGSAGQDFAAMIPDAKGCEGFQHDRRGALP